MTNVSESNKPAEVTKTIEVPRDAEIQVKKDVKDQRAVEILGDAIIKKAGELAGLYLKLCLYIRQEKVAPKLVSYVLARQGFKRSRISEINRVANAPDKVFKEYEAKLIGFDKALEFSRIEDGKPVATKAAGLLVAGGAVTQKEADAVIKDEQTPADAKGESKKQQTTGQKMKAHAMALGKLAFRQRHEWVCGNYRITVEKIAKQNGPSLGDE